MECVFFEKDHLELQKHVSVFAAFLFGPDGRPRTMPVVFSNDPTKQYMVRYTGDLPIDRVRGLGTFKLPFVAYDPWAYKETTSDLLRWDTDYTWEDDFAWDEGYSFDFRDPGEVEINNLGILNAEPIIEIIGTFSSLSLTVGGVVFTYNIPMSGI